MLWLWIMKRLCCLFCYMFKLKICGVAQSLVLNYFALLSLCATFFALVMCCCSTALKIVVLKIITKVMDLTLPIFVPICPKESDNSWTEVLSLCAWVFGVCLPSGGVACKAFFLMFLHACVGCAIALCLKVNWSACQLSQMQFVFCFLEVVLVFQSSVAMF